MLIDPIYTPQLTWRNILIQILYNLIDFSSQVFLLRA